MSLFQSNLRKQIRNLPKILNFVKIIHYFSKLFTSLLRPDRGLAGAGRGRDGARAPHGVTAGHVPDGGDNILRSGQPCRLRNNSTILNSKSVISGEDIDLSIVITSTPQILRIPQILREPIEVPWVFPGTAEENILYGVQLRAVLC